MKRLFDLLLSLGGLLVLALPLLLLLSLYCRREQPRRGAKEEAAAAGHTHGA